MGKVTKNQQGTLRPANTSAPNPRQEHVPLRIPACTVAFTVDGRCMEPAIPDGSMVFAAKATDLNIAVGTPVVVIPKHGRRLCKLWNGKGGDGIFLRAMGSGPGIQERVVLLYPEIAEIWLVLGVWYNGVLPGGSKASGNVAKTASGISILRDNDPIGVGGPTVGQMFASLEKTAEREREKASAKTSSAKRSA